MVLLNCVLICLSQGSLDSKANKSTQASLSKEGSLKGKCRVSGHFMATYEFRAETKSQRSLLSQEHIIPLLSGSLRFSLICLLSPFCQLLPLFCPWPSEIHAPTLCRDLCLSTVSIAKFKLFCKNLVGLPAPWECYPCEAVSKAHGQSGSSRRGPKQRSMKPNKSWALTSWYCLAITSSSCFGKEQLYYMPELLNKHPAAIVQFCRNYTAEAVSGSF